MTADLLQRRFATLGPYSPLFYDEPLELVCGERVWVTDAAGRRHLDGYNNVPNVGHAHPRVVEAIREQASRSALHTRYLNERIVDYAERLLGTFDPALDRLMPTNSGSESNDLAIRIARQHTGARGMLVSDFSYHGHTITLAELTTGLRTAEGLAPHVRGIRIPDLDGADAGRDEAEMMADALAEAEAAIVSLHDAGHGLAAVLLDALFSTEGLNRVPEGYVAALASLVRRHGGLVIADEVQSGFGRTGAEFWGHRNHGMVPDLVTMGKPMGNGHPMGGVVLPAALLDEFGPRNMYFNTFGGNPVSAAAGGAVLEVIADEQLLDNVTVVGEHVRAGLERLRSRHPLLGPVKGRGLFFGVELPEPAMTKRVVEGMKRRQVLISRIGRTDAVLKMRPPLVLNTEEADVLLSALDESLADL